MKMIIDFLVATYFSPFRNENKEKGMLASLILVSMVLTLNIDSIICYMAPLLKGIVNIESAFAGAISVAIVTLIIWLCVSVYLDKAYKDKIEYIDNYTNKLPSKVWSSIAIVYFILSSFISTFCMKYLLCLRA